MKMQYLRLLCVSGTRMRVFRHHKTKSCQAGLCQRGCRGETHGGALSKAEIPVEIQCTAVIWPVAGGLELNHL